MSTCKGYGPDSFSKFTHVDAPIDVIIQKYIRMGYAHALILPGPDGTHLTCGDMQEEYRHFGPPYLFFVDEPPQELTDFVAGKVTTERPIVILEARKFYTDMSSTGQGVYVGEFTPQEVVAWLEFWEKTKSDRKPLHELLLAA